VSSMAFRIRSISATAVVLAFGGAAVPAALRAAHPHPHFDDRGTLAWTTRLDDAREAARQTGKLILVEYGRAS